MPWKYYVVHRLVRSFAVPLRWSPSLRSRLKLSYTCWNCVQLEAGLDVGKIRRCTALNMLLFIPFIQYLSRNVKKKKKKKKKKNSTFCYVHPVKTQMSLRTRTVWSQSLYCPIKETLHPWLSKWRAQGRFRSDCANAQADLNLRWVHTSEGTYSDIATHLFFSVVNHLLIKY